MISLIIRLLISTMLLITVANTQIITNDQLFKNSYFIKLGIFSSDKSVYKLKKKFINEQLYIHSYDSGSKAIYLVNFLDKKVAKSKLKQVKRDIKDAYMAHISAKEMNNFFSISKQKKIKENNYKIKINHIKTTQMKDLKNQNNKQKILISQLSDRIDDLEDHIDDVETNTLVDKLNFSLGIRNRVDNFSRTYADGNKNNSNAIMSMKVMFNTKARISKNMKFNGRLSMFKYWADSTMHTYSSFDNMQGRVPADSKVYLERAYVDWLVNPTGHIPVAFTIGRQPSSDGPSHQFKNNTKRKSTYSALVFDGASDGAVFTLNLDNIWTLKNSRLRFAYGKGYQNDETKDGVQNAFIGTDNLLKDTAVYGSFFESSIFNIDRTLFQIGFVNMKDLVANSLDKDSSTNTNLGDLSFAGIMLEATNLYASGFDMFIHAAYSKAIPNGNIYNFEGKSYGLLGDSSSYKSRNGNAFWLGGRYTFKNFYSTKIGLEYNHGSKNWMTVSQGAYDLANKLSTRGDVYETYFIYPINKYSFLKLGAMYVDYAYTGSGWYLGKPKEISKIPTSLKSEVIDSLKNMSLEFSINY